MADAGHPAGRYGSVSRFLHWSMAALILVNLPLGLLSDTLEDAGYETVGLHKSIGLTLLALALIRIGWRLMNPPPPLPASVSRREARIAVAVHVLLYGLMLALPLTGYVFSSAGKYPLTWFDLFGVPKLALTRDDAIVGLSREGHEILGWVMIAAALGHIAAALRHHLVLRDGVLRRMLG
ncbi:cytochrome b [Sphingomonas sp. S1-29]|uniref:cytochrome b n=1 Tax=Sphingomonas sp. S1-29 TaxID=2991074 RepID=UPI00223F072D|nr:cytochrome b [Sphingomonas sp. S1-29]UZK68683.1 cytochrome b [Sphingomonas sp. S1-29]